jgi:hypothetical protein
MQINLNREKLPTLKWIFRQQKPFQKEGMLIQKVSVPVEMNVKYLLELILIFLKYEGNPKRKKAQKQRKERSYKISNAKNKTIKTMLTELICTFSLVMKGKKSFPINFLILVAQIQILIIKYFFRKIPLYLLENANLKI